MDAVAGYSAANGTYTMPSSGRVRLDGRLVGTIVDSGRRTCFTYLPDWLARPDATPISLTVPLRSEPYVSEGVHPFCENLLPESRLLDIAARKLKISKKDTFGPLQLADGAIACFIERIDRLADATQLPLEDSANLPSWRQTTSTTDRANCAYASCENSRPNPWSRFISSSNCCCSVGGPPTAINT